MHKPPDKDHSYLVYHFEMGSVDEVYSNFAYTSDDDEASAGNTTRTCKCKTGPQDTMGSGNHCQCPKNPKRESLYDVVGQGSCQGIVKGIGNEPGGGNQQGGGVHSPCFPVYDRCDDAFGPSRCKRKRSEGGVYVNLAEKEECSRKGVKHPKQSGKRKQSYDITAGAAPGNQHCESSPCSGKRRLMVILQVIIFLMAAASLALVMMIINGKIVCSADTAGDSTTKTQKQTDLSSRFDELQGQISKLKEELDDARQEMKELKEKSELRIEKLITQVEQMKNSTHQRNTLNDTSQVNHTNEKVDFELMLNSTQQTMMTMISDVWFSINKTDKELREETRSLRLTGNSTQDEIHKVADNLVKLGDKVRLHERRLNGTIQLKVKHHVHSLELLINNSRQDMINKLNQMWSSVNTTSKDLQERVRSSRQAVWTALNTTSMELQRLQQKLNLVAVLLQSADASLLASLVEVNTTITEKVNNVSKMAGPIGPQGFNGSQGPVGRNGSIGPLGPKGSGDFSKCQYKLKTEQQTPGDITTTAGLNEPNGKRILGVTCSTNYAKEYNLLSIVHNNVRRYSCTCKGTSNLFSPFGEPSYCYIHYWECPLTT